MSHIDLTVEQLDRICDEAARDAASFVEEFPGERIDGDWDATAWSMAPADLQELPDAWDVYSAELRAEIRRLNRQACQETA